MPKQIAKKVAITVDEFDSFSLGMKKMRPSERLETLKKLGVGVDVFTCQYCGEPKNKGDFHMSTEPYNMSRVSRICKSCAAKIAMPIIDGVQQQPNKETCDEALFYMNKPMLDVVWDGSLLEAANTQSGKSKSNVWTAICKNVSMPQYSGLTYRQSDNYTGGIYSIDSMEKDALPKDQEILQQFEKNKDDTLRLLGYLPFEKEKLADQPFLYSQLIGFLDSSEEGNDDMMRTSSIISIVRGFLQISQIDDMIADLVKDTKNIDGNIAAIKGLQQMKTNITQSVTKLAEQSCISLKNSKNATKGENTWTGKIKKIKDLNLREGEINGFDIATCKGMQQVIEMSDASIFNQLKFDESEWSDMVAEQRVMLRSAQRERDCYQEISRILLRENIDLRDTLSEHNMLKDENLVDLDELYMTLDIKDDSNVGE